MSRLTCSVAMATYNGAKFIEEQLRSIENQTIKPDEVVICDDGSKDSTVAIIEDFIKKSPLNISLHRNKENLGFYKNFEKSISLCKGDIVFLCDQDDSWLPIKIERMMTEFKNNDVVYVFSDAYVTDENLNVTIKSILETYNFDWAALDRQSFFDKAQSRVFPLGFQAACRRDFLEKIMPFIAAHDRWIACCAPVFGDVKVINDKLVFYRRHTAATSYTAGSGSKLGLIKRIVDTDYYRFFLYPNKEKIIYSKVVEYIESGESELDKNGIENHLKYVNALVNAKDRGIIFRLRTLNKLKQEGLHLQFRGSGKTYMLDCIFMVVNSFKRKTKR